MFGMSYEILSDAIALLYIHHVLNGASQKASFGDCKAKADVMRQALDACEHQSVVIKTPPECTCFLQHVCC